MDANDFLKNKIEEAIPSKFKNVTELARKADVPQPILSKFLSEYKGKKTISFENAWKILELLSVTDKLLNTLNSSENNIEEQLIESKKQVALLKEENAMLRGENRVLERLISNSPLSNIEQHQKEKEQIQRVEFKK